MNKKECPVCGNEATVYIDYNRDTIFYECPICGRFQITLDEHTITSNNQLASYLYHNSFTCKGFGEYRYHTTLEKETCDKYKKDFQEGDNTHGLPVHMDSEMINNWYPKSFSERVDRILLKLGSLAKHIGQSIPFRSLELFGLLFIDRKEKNQLSGEITWRDTSACREEAAYMLNCLSAEDLIEYAHTSKNDLLGGKITITPKGYSRIDMLQKNTANGRVVLVAMKFGADTMPLREAIRKGIHDAEYQAVFIDEVQHNDYITPELLKYIRDSKFVVVDLTHKNNGAYFEEGYAMGLGKQVIQLCRKNRKLHFDVAQKNTIMWATEEDIPLMLSNRIKATID